jgi:hypothetical protein
MTSRRRERKRAMRGGSILGAALAWAAVLTGMAGAQTTALDCLPPTPPVGIVTKDLLQEYEDEIRAEFSAYFDEAQAYLMCLDAAGRTVRAEVQAVLRDHQWLFPQ